MRVYMIAGEASGDLHGSFLTRTLKKENQELIIRGWGGNLMQEAGVDLVKHYRDLAFMGFVAVVKNLRTILRNLKNCKADILDFKPDVLVLIDYPGFNMRIAKWAKSNNIKVVYYIAPQAWAWNASRVKGLKEWVDRVVTILPFEKAFFAKHGLPTDFVGHPLLEELHSYEYAPLKHDELKNKKVCALLPGSRKQEISRMLPTMLKACDELGLHGVVAMAPAIPKEFYETFRAISSNVSFIPNRTYDILKIADIALVTSGTATLETALHKVPQVVCYRGGSINYAIAKLVVKVPYISLVNLILDKPLLKELIQSDFTLQNLKSEITQLAIDENNNLIQKGYADLRDKLMPDNASEGCAQIIKSLSNS